jgi:hypothetical protein
MRPPLEISPFSIRESRERRPTFPDPSTHWRACAPRGIILASRKVPTAVRFYRGQHCSEICAGLHRKPFGVDPFVKFFQQYLVGQPRGWGWGAMHTVLNLEL